MQNTQNVNYREMNRWANLRLLMVAAALVLGVILLLRAWRTTTDAAIDVSAQPTVQAIPLAADLAIPAGPHRGADGRIRINPPVGWQWEGDRQAACKEQGMRLWEDLTPDGKAHAGYHCAP